MDDPARRRCFCLLICPSTCRSTISMPSMQYKTCDICRKRKASPGRPQYPQNGPVLIVQTKCLPPSDDNEKHDKEAACMNCARLGIKCTYDHVYKRPGRPTS
jgi:hypothetical protein